MNRDVTVVVPVLHFDEVFHVGKLDGRRRRSYEDNALSVSRCPDRWKDGTFDPYTMKYPLWCIDVRGARFLDEASLDSLTRERILTRAERKGLLEWTERNRVTTFFTNGEPWYEDLIDPAKSKWASASASVSHQIIEEVPVYRITDNALAEGNLLPMTGWLAEWSAIARFARECALEGAWQRYYGCRTDLVHPHGCVFDKERWMITPSSRSISGRAPLEGLPAPQFASVTWPD